MEDILSVCHWPNLDEPYASALKQAVAFILNRFQPTGIIASGSILRGNPGPSSDLDIYVIHSQTWRQRLQKFFNGVPAEIFVNPEKQILSYFNEDQRDGRLITAHMVSTGVVILDRDPVIKHVRDKAKEYLAVGIRLDESHLTAMRYMRASQIEDGMDVANADPATALMFFNQAVPDILAYRFLKDHQAIPRSKELLRQLALIDPELASMADQFYMEPEPGERIRLAQTIARLSMGTDGFFEWESQPEEV
jgi:predicted nucleotidyltransferase